MAAPNTPNLDAQILKLRRLLGDITNEDGTLIDSSNVYSSTSGVTWLQQELLDIYNDAIRQFMVYLVQNFPKEKWWEYLPGYITYFPGVFVNSGALAIDDLDPTMFQLLDVRITPTNSFVSTIAGFACEEVSVTGGALPNGDYYFVVAPLNDRCEGAPCAEVHVNIADGIGDKSIFGSWTPLVGATKYRVYWGTVTGDENRFFDISSNSFVLLATSNGVPGIPGAKAFGGDIGGLGVYIPPHQWFACLAGLDKVRKPDADHTFYTILTTNLGDDLIPSVLVAPSSISYVDLIYLRDHIDFIQDDADRGDLWGISQDGLRRVLMFAEVIARRWKSTEAADVPEAELKQMIALDMNKQKE